MEEEIFEDDFEEPELEKSKRPPGIYVTWHHLLVVFFLVVVVIIWGFSYVRLSSPEFIATVSSIPPTLNLYDDTLEIYAAEGWQPTGLWLEKGQYFRIQYMQGSWSIFPDDDVRYTADGGAAACGQPDCVEPIPDYTTSGLIGRIGDGVPFPVGSYLETTAQYTGTLQLRVNDAGTHDNEGSVIIRVSNIRQ
jgi:hypothetical protein